MRYVLLLCPFFCISSTCIAQIKPARIFSDNMVLQRGIETPIWGTAEPGKIITVSFRGETAACKSDSNGKWKVVLRKCKEGGPFNLEISNGVDNVFFKNVMVGDVWFASGQSNMEHPIRGWEQIPHSGVDCFNEEIPDSNYPEIRLFSVVKYPSPVVQSDLSDGRWETANPESVAKFSSIAWFFAKGLYEKLNVPIGIINSSWGGTPIKTWMSRDMLGNFKDSLKLADIPEHFNPKEWDGAVSKSIEKNHERRMKISYPPDSLPAIFSNPGFSDHSWQQVNLLEEEAHFSNVVWLRKSIDVPEQEKNKPLSLSLGFLNRQSNIYWNGEELGYCQYPKPVKFEIPGNQSQAGENIITVRIAQPWGNAQALGGVSQFYLSTPDSSFLVSLAGNWRSNDMLETVPPVAKNYQNNPAFLFNGMVAPVIPYGIKGFIWYQGESDTGRPALYEKMFRQLIINWRERWQMGNLPFLYFQISKTNLSHQATKTDSWTLLRIAQQKALGLPNTGMVVTSDIGDPFDIHPKNKKQFAERMVLKAEEIVYNKAN